MNLTERAELVLDIARRIEREKARGWPVDPSRLEWAEQIVNGNRPPVARDPAERRARACAFSGAQS